MTDAAPSRTQQLIETYGGAAVITFLGLLFLEMVVLTPLVHFGVDLSSFYAWLQRTAGWEVTTEGAGQSWFLSAGIAYGITRVLKPLQIMVALPMIPLVARWTRRDGAESPETDA